MCVLVNCRVFVSIRTFQRTWRCHESATLAMVFNVARWFSDCGSPVGRGCCNQPVCCVFMRDRRFSGGVFLSSDTCMCVCVYFSMCVCVCVIQLCSRRSLSAQLAQQTAHCVLLSAVQPLSTLWKRTIGTKNIEKYSIGEWKIKNVQKHRRL